MMAVIETNEFSELPIDDAKAKPLTYEPSLYKKISDKYYAIIDKLHLRPLTNVIDKFMPSMIFFTLLFIIIIVLILYFALASGVSVNEYSLSISLNGKPYLDSYTISLTGNSVQLLTSGTTKGKTKFTAEENSRLLVKVIIGKDKFEEYIITNANDLTLNLKTNSDVTKTEEKKDYIYSFVLTTPNGTLNKSGNLKISCDSYSQDYPISNGILNNIKIPCKSLSVLAVIENMPSATQMCNPGVCKINMSDNLSTDKIKEILPTNTLVIYVNNKDGSSALGINVEVRDDSLSQALVDSGITKDFGSYTVDLVAGDYIISISDLSGKFASQQKKVKVTAGSLEPIIFVLDVPSIGNIVADFKVEDSNIISGTVYFKDENLSILQTKPFDSNEEIKFPISVKEKYYISVDLDAKYKSDYLGLDNIEVNYNQDSGDKDLTLNIRKLNPFTDQNVIVQVTELQTGKPIPFANIYFTDKDKKLLNSLGENITTDANGVFSTVLPVGGYLVYLSHYKLSGVEGFAVIETKSLELTKLPVNLKVSWGNSKINVCLFENDVPTNDAILDVYSVERGFLGTYVLGTDKNCFDSFEEKRLENIYFKVTKEDYFDLYSQTFFLVNEENDNNPLNVKLNLEKKVIAKPITELNPEFLGIYNDDTLSIKSNKLNKNTDYYYAFKVKVPKGKAVSGRTINFYGLAGNQNDKNVDYSKIVIEYLGSIGTNMLYSNYDLKFNEDNLEIAEKRNDKYFAKSVTSKYEFDEDSENDLEIIYSVMVRTTDLIDDTKAMGDEILFWYDFTLDDKLPDLKSILKKIGTLKCDESICVDAYIGGYELKGVYTVPVRGNIYGKIYFNNNEDKNLIIYNKPSNGSDIIENIKNLDVLFNSGNINLIDIYGQVTSSKLNEGPIYFEQKTNVDSADYDFNYELDSNKDSSIIFRPYNKWQPNDKNNGRININIEETETLDVVGLPKLIVPFIKNTFIISVNDSKTGDGKNKAEVKYYTKDNLGNWIPRNTVYTNIAGNVEITTIPVAINQESKFVIYSQGFKPNVQIINSDLSYFTAEDSKLSFSYPDDSKITTDNNVEVYNDSDYDVNVFNLSYTLDATSSADSEFIDLFLNTKSMEASIGPGFLVKPKTKLQLQVNYDPELLLQINKTIPISETVHFNFVPKDAVIVNIIELLDVNLSRVFDLDLTFGFNGKPDYDDCYLVSIEKIPNDDIDQENLEAVFLDGMLDAKYNLFIENDCDINSRKITFAKVKLEINNIKNLNVIGKSQDNPEDSFSYSKGIDSIELFEATKPGKHTYSLDLILGAGFKLDTSEIISFTLTPYYYETNNNSEIAEPKEYISKKTNSLKVNNNSLSNCLKFGLKQGESDDFKMSTFLPEANLPNDYLRFPYYYKKANFKYSIYDHSKYIFNVFVNGNNYFCSGPDLEYNSENKELELQNVEISPIYENDILPLQIENTCGIDLYFDINSVFGDLKLSNLNNIFGKVIKAGQIKYISAKRNELSGAAVLLLLASRESDLDLLPVSTLKINVESTYKEKYFVEFPFVNSQEIQIDNWKVYYNDYNLWFGGGYSSNPDLFDIEQKSPIVFAIANAYYNTCTDTCYNYNDFVPITIDNKTIFWILEDVFNSCNSITCNFNENEAHIFNEDLYGVMMFCNLGNSLENKIPRISTSVQNTNGKLTKHGGSKIDDEYSKLQIYNLNNLPITTSEISVPECNGGFTGKDYAPDLDFESDDCIIDIENKDKNVNACSLKSFANVLERQITSGNKDFQVKLMNDNYTKDNLIAMSKDFLAKKNIFDIVYLDGSPVGVLPPGIYNVKIKNQGDVNTKVYISYSSFILPNHIFYYMPFDGSVKGYGTSVDKILNVNGTSNYPLSDINAGLNHYDIINSDFEELNSVGENYGLVLKGNPNSSTMIYNDLELKKITIDVYATDLISAKINNTFIKPSLLKENWYVFANNELIYPETLGIKITETANGIEFKLPNNSPKYTFYKLFFVPKESNLQIFDEYNDLISISELSSSDVDVSSISNIIDEIGKSNICYKNSDNTFYYYFNIENILKKY